MVSTHNAVLRKPKLIGEVNVNDLIGWLVG